jgi:hypothetical protein
MFGRKKKRASSKNLPKMSGENSALSALSVTPEMIQEAILQAKIPQEMKEAVLSELPNFVEHIDEATRKIFDPSAIWLESIQFADYVSQMADHILADHGKECIREIGTQLKYISETFVDVAENSMQIIDHSDKIINKEIDSGTLK